MAKQGSIPEVDIVIDHEAGVIREVHPPRLRNKKTHERRVNRGIYILLSVISVIWLAPFVFLDRRRRYGQLYSPQGLLAG